MRSIYDAEREFYKRFKLNDLVMYNNQMHILYSYNPLSCRIWLIDDKGKHFSISTSDSEKLSPAY